MPFFECEYLPRPTQMDRSGADTTATPTTAAPTTRPIVRALVQTTPLVPQQEVPLAAPPALQR